MFANAAQDHEQAEEAVMASPVISGVPNFCFEFYFDLKVIWSSDCFIIFLRYSCKYTTKKEKLEYQRLKSLTFEYFNVAILHLDFYFSNWLGN